MTELIMARAASTDVKEPSAAGVVDQQPEKQGSIAVAIHHGVEEGAEASHLVAGAGDAAIDQIEESCPEDHEAGIEEHAGLVVGVGVAEQKCSHGIDH